MRLNSINSIHTYLCIYNYIPKIVQYCNTETEETAHKLAFFSFIMELLGVIDDWFTEYDQRKRLRDEAFKMKVLLHVHYNCSHHIFS